MAFMMPVMKNNYDIYKDSRSRKTSECSNTSSNGGGGNSALSAAMGHATPTNGRSRKVSECKSESFATSPSHTYRMQMQRCQSSRAFPRNASRSSSHSSATGVMSPTRSFCQASSPPKTATSIAEPENHSDISKFHLRLVEKLRKSFRKDSAKRS